MLYILVLLTLIAQLPVKAQAELDVSTSALEIHFSGSIRTDTVFNTRQMLELSGSNVGSIWPLQKEAGQTPYGLFVPDLLSRPSSTAATVLPTFSAAANGLHIGPAEINLYTSINFAGFDFGDGVGLLTNAFGSVAFENHSVALGRMNHPLMFTQCIPNMVTLELGAPITPFALSPQFRYEYHRNHLSVDLTLFEQYLIANNGPLVFPYNFTNLYSRNSTTPGVQLGAQYTADNWLVGAAVNTQRLRPRLFTDPVLFENQLQPSAVATAEHISTVAYTMYGSYSGRYITLCAQLIRGSNGTGWSNLGGYGVASVNPLTNQKKYVPIYFQSWWVDLNCGGENSCFQPGIYAGYTNNRGSKRMLYRSPSTNLLEVYTLDGYQRYTEQLFDIKPQALMRLARIAPRLWFYLSRNFALGAELSYFIATYAEPNNYYKPILPHTVRSLQAIASIQYLY